MFLMQQKMINFIKISTQSKYVFTVLYDNMNSAPETLAADWSTKGTCAIIWVAIWTSCFFHRVPFLLEKNNWKNMVIQTWVFGEHFLENERNETHFKETSWRFLLPVIKNIPAFKKNLEFWRTCMCHHEIDSFPLKDFTDEINGDMNECDFWIMTNGWCYKIVHGQKPHSKDFTLTGWNVNRLRFQIPQCNRPLRNYLL